MHDETVPHQISPGQVASPLLRLLGPRSQSRWRALDRSTGPYAGCGVRVEYGSYADGTERGPRTVYWSGRRSRPRPRQGTGGGRRYQGVAGRSRAVDDSDSSADLLDRQSRADWLGLVEVRSSLF